MGFINTRADEISSTIIGCAIRIHNEVGPGLFESVYELLLADGLGHRGLLVERQGALPIRLEGRTFKKAFRTDLFVERQVVVETKSAAGFSPVDSKQLMTYLRLLQCRNGLLLNFGAERLGIKRLLNGY